MDEHAMHAVRRFSDDQNARDIPDTDHLRSSLAQIIEFQRTEEQSGRITLSGFISETTSHLTGQPQLTQEFDEENERLDQHAKSLDDAWKRLVEKIQHNEKTASTTGSIELNPTKDSLNSIIKECETKLLSRDKSRWAKTTAWFRKTASTVNNHNYLFALIPAGDKYTSIITGSFTALVKAGAAYDDVVDRFGDYFDTIHDKTVLLQQCTTAMPHSPFLRIQAIKFATALFEFLCKVLTWLSSSWGRFMKSLSDVFRKTCDRLIAQMREYQENATSYYTTKSLNSLGWLVEAQLFSQAQRHYKRTDAQTLIAASHTASGSSLLSGDPGLLESEENETDAASIELVASSAGWDKSSILDSTAHLAEYSQDELLQRLSRRFKDLSVHVEVYSKIQKWISSPSTGALGIEGPEDATVPSVNSLCAAYISSKVQQLGIPVVRYFCSHDYQQPLDAGEKLRDLVYSLIYQVIMALPEQVDSSWRRDLDLSHSRLACLDGELGSLDSCIDLLGDLLKLAPPLMFCIIDELQLLQRGSRSESIQSCLEHFLDTLLSREVGINASTVLKVMFSTDGICLPLKKQQRLGHIEMVLSTKGRRTELLRLRESDLPDWSSHSEV